ncbi:peptidylprolyl isomerase SurA [Colwellia sp. 4_MG-2023]|uniref:peptidylprolyl isomerase SurA n=1 Tax=unclassified Colwellia TaxID=196834 RepID=UPI001C085B53|nr:MULTISPECIES: peptidylprolyl isomerase SurA [unclassified Colwellia]MBU2925046.1 peptidylprolyl isomerase SurA [Colwellia sp. C2M11]MDO6486451.1 peptidylprolyl isomerase SurA [Colwellia sp. 6_MG-2023]MDO6506329.1 peptidylprolyl isomerase SurA [Colwellia sp. 5_MG-2023]MDO6555153.1 peptidylprolyl isomerase SurA [Colwellia sp. 4_MG-2023]MDO6651661.1 peptidylprolyl isomerase SurA [Colwellia sp. 3_MG-2023]
MKNLATFLLKTLILTTVLHSSLPIAQAEEKQLDKVAAIVNSSVVLESEVQSLLENIKQQAIKNNQALPSNNALRTQVMDKLINDSLTLQIGERMGVQVSDAQLDQTITNMAMENKLTLSQFRQSLINDGTDYEKYRESVRTELISGEVRRNSVQRRIHIAPQEVANLLELMKEQTTNDVEYNLGHILIEFPSDPTQAELNSNKERADKVIELLNNGSDFKKIAIASSGGANALAGGDLGWKNINEMPTLFSELIAGKDKGTVVGPIRTGLGFSIVKILDIRGRQIVEVEEVKASHILIKPSIILSEEKAEAQLQAILDKIKAGEQTFAEAAKEFSEGPTSVRGGDLGWADPKSYDPAFKEALATMQPGEYHKPFRSSFGWHIIQLNDRRMVDATSQMNQNRAYQILHSRKFALEEARWMKETRDEAYIEIFEQDK